MYYPSLFKLAFTANEIRKNLVPDQARPPCIKQSSEKYILNYHYFLNKSKRQYFIFMLVNQRIVEAILAYKTVNI